MPSVYSNKKMEIHRTHRLITLKFEFDPQAIAALWINWFT